MTWPLQLALFTALLLALLVSGQWIALALVTTALIGLFLHSGADAFWSIGYVAWNSINSFSLTAVPLFLLMGGVILRCGISERFYRSVAVLLRFLPGSLLHANILSCTIFAAICGSSVATAAAIGTVAIPEMQRRGYDRAMIFGSLAAGGTLGILIPPSVVMIIYAAIVEESVARLFLAGVVPGLLLALIFSAYISVRVLLQPSLAPRNLARTTLQESLRALVDFLPVAVLILSVVGTIYLGWATPTEAAALGVAFALLIAAAYRGLTWVTFKPAMVDAVRTTCMVLFIVVGAQLFSYALVNSGVSRDLTEWVVSLQLSRVALFLFIVVLYLVLGCLVDGASMMLLTLPVLYPVVAAAQFDPIWFGIVLVVLIEIGMITPPVGLNLFVIQGMSGGRPLMEVVRGSWPYVLLMLGMVALLWVVPDIALWLPRRMSN